MTITRRALLAAALSAPAVARERSVAIAADFDPVASVWLSHDPGHEDLTAGLVRALAPQVPLTFLVADAAAEERLREFARSRDLPLDGARVVRDSLASFFLRDVAVFTRGAAGAAGVVDFRWSQYGVPAWCARRHAGDPQEADRCAASVDGINAQRDALDQAIARHLGLSLHPTPLAIEGGGVESNGRGLLIANEALWRSRNPKLATGQIERDLLRLPGVQKVVWLPAGLAEDGHLRATVAGDYVAWGSGGHTDQFVRFADERTVLLAWPEDRHPVARRSRARMERNARLLAAASTVAGERLRVVRIPMPRPVERPVLLSGGADTSRSEGWTADFFPPSEGRRQGQPLTQLATASYLNFVVAGPVLVLPDYRPHGTPADRQARVQRLFERAFPGRRVHFVDAISANWVGGGLHCATLNQPAPWP